MGEAYKIFGLLGSFVIAASFVPQIHKVYRTKSASDLSYRFQLLYAAGQTMVLIYGLGRSLWPIYIPCSMELFTGLVLLVLKTYYNFKEPREITKSPHSLEAAASRSPTTQDFTSVQTPQ